MSKINVQFDTVEKTLSVNIDGKTLDNVTSVNFGQCYDYIDGKYNPDGDMNCSISMQEDNDDMKIYHTLMASKSKEGEIALQKGDILHKIFPEFVVVSSKHQSESKIANYIGQFLQS